MVVRCALYTKMIGETEHIIIGTPKHVSYKVVSPAE